MDTGHKAKYDDSKIVSHMDSWIGSSVGCSRKEVDMPCLTKKRELPPGLPFPIPPNDWYSTVKVALLRAPARPGRSNEGDF